MKEGFTWVPMVRCFSTWNLNPPKVGFGFAANLSRAWDDLLGMSSQTPSQVVREASRTVRASLAQARNQGPASGTFVDLNVSGEKETCAINAHQTGIWWQIWDSSWHSSLIWTQLLLYIYVYQLSQRVGRDTFSEKSVLFCRGVGILALNRREARIGLPVISCQRRNLEVLQDKII